MNLSVQNIIIYAVSFWWLNTLKKYPNNAKIIIYFQNLPVVNYHYMVALLKALSKGCVTANRMCGQEH